MGCLGEGDGQQTGDSEQCIGFGRAMCFLLFSQPTTNKCAVESRGWLFEDI